MVTGISADKIESVTPYHEIRKSERHMRYDYYVDFWVLFIPFDGQFHDVSHYTIYEEHMKQFYFYHCYNVINYKGKVILC